MDGPSVCGGVRGSPVAATQHEHGKVQERWMATIRARVIRWLCLSEGLSTLQMTTC